MIEFRLHTESIQLAQLLKATGLCSTGGQAKLRVEAGDVLVDGDVELRRGRRLRPGNVVEIDGEQILVLPPASSAGPFR